MKEVKLIIGFLLFILGIYFAYQGAMLCLATLINPSDGQAILGLMLGAPLFALASGMMASGRALCIDKKILDVLLHALGGASAGFGLSGLVTMFGSCIVIAISGGGTGQGFWVDYGYSMILFGSFFGIFFLIGLQALRKTAYQEDLVSGDCSEQSDTGSGR